MRTQSTTTGKINKWALLALAVMLVLQLGFLAFQGTRKLDYHMDEISQYNLANSYYNPFMWMDKHLLNEWHSGDYFLKAVTVDPAHRFSYGSVIENQRWDVHPPLSYMVLNTICSFTPGFFSKWQGIGMNLAFFVGTSILLFLLARRILQNDFAALAPCLWWGFSSGAASTAMYVRMYMMAAMFCVWCVWCGARMALLQKWSRGLQLAVVLSSFMGFMTHYYFLLVLALVWAALALLFILQRRPKAIIRYSLLCLAGGAAGIALFYSAAYQILFGYRGTENIGNFFNFAPFLGNIAASTGVLNTKIFGGLLPWVALAVLALFAVVIIRRRTAPRKMVYTDREARELRVVDVPTQKPQLAWYWRQPATLLVLGIVAGGYLLIVAKVAPENVLHHQQDSDRYLMMVMPLLVLLAVALVLFPLGKLVKNAGVSCTAALGLAILCAGLSLHFGGVNYLYETSRQPLALTAEYANYPTFTIFNQKGVLVMHTLPYIAQHKQIYSVTLDNVDDIQQAVIERNIEGPIVIYATRNWVLEGHLTTLMETLGYEGCEKLLQKNAYRCYVITPQAQPE